MSTPLPETCAWWGRWWHARKRRIDALTAIQALVERAPPGRLLDAVALFWQMEGQEHWWCPCARPDRLLYVQMLAVLEEAEGADDNPGNLHISANPQEGA